MAERGVLGEWTAAVRAELGLTDLPLDERLILRMARDVAHTVDRPAAPVTAYLLGLAVAGGAEPADAVARIGELVRRWPANPP